MTAARVTVVLFPGSNCDEDAVIAARNVMAAEARLVRHDERDLGNPDLVILPGGFSYGDYLRSGAMARFSPAMDSVAAFAEKGGAVLGICNGFQILCEAGLLPGAMLRNAGLRFVCKDVFLRVETKRTPFTLVLNRGEVLRVPIAHGDGNWTADPETFRRMEERDQIVFRYVDESGRETPGANPNGSLANVGGICNAQGNVVGLMPHPERASEAILSPYKNENARKVFSSLKVATARTAFTREFAKGEVFQSPTAHGEGNFVIGDAGLKDILENDQVVFKYCDDAGRETPEANPNGSLLNIAGVCNLEGNVVGLMPHPERASETILSPYRNENARKVFAGLKDFLGGKG